MTQVTVQNKYAQRLVEICDKLIEKFEWNLEAEDQEFKRTGSRRINSTEDIKRVVHKAKMEAGLNHGLGISSLYERIVPKSGWAAFCDFFGYSKPEDFTVDNIRQQAELAHLVMSIVALYTEWKSDEFDSMIGDISDNLNISSDKQVDPKILEDINKMVLNGTFKAYKYIDSGESINLNDDFHISTVIGFSQDLTMWLDHVKKQDEFLSKQESNKVFITMFGKLDEVHPIYSNWLFTMHKGSTIWIVTDQVDFDNPYQKVARLSRRSAWRDADEKYEDTDLPYNLFHEIDKLIGEKNKLAKGSSYERVDFINFNETIRENYTYGKKNAIIELRDVLADKFKKKLESIGVAYTHIEVVFADESRITPELNCMYARHKGQTVAYAHDGEVVIYRHPEVYFKQFSDLSGNQQTFAILLMKEVMQYMASNIEMEQIILSRDFTEIKLLEGAKIDPVNTSHMRHWKDAHKEVFDELVETLTEGDEVCTAVAKHGYDVVVNTKQYDANWLSTPDKLASLAEWNVLDDERSKLEPKLRALADTSREAEQWLFKTLNDNYDEIVKRVSIANNIDFIHDGFDSWGDTPQKCRRGYIWEIKGDKGIDGKRGYGVGKTEWAVEDCIPCGKVRIKQNQARRVKNIHIRSYKELMWILGYTDRKQLHPYYRQFRAHNMLPYNGNSLLDQTHPYTRLKDPCSKDNTNGITFGLYMCGSCYRNIKHGTDSVEIEL